MLDGIRIIIASKSPRRKELVAMMDIPFIVSDDFVCEEEYPSDLQPEKIPEYLSRLKSEAYPHELADGDILMTADTVVIVDGKVLGKPEDLEDAKKMIRMLSGKTHEVVTGVSIRNNNSQIKTFSEISYVTFREIDDQEIDYYVGKYDPEDKAGAYGIQEWVGAVAISSIQGSFYNIVGLPTERLFVELKNF